MQRTMISVIFMLLHLQSLLDWHTVYYLDPLPSRPEFSPRHLHRFVSLGHGGHRGRPWASEMLLNGFETCVVLR